MGSPAGYLPLLLRDRLLRRTVQEPEPEAVEASLDYDFSIAPRGAPESVRRLGAVGIAPWVKNLPQTIGSAVQTARPYAQAALSALAPGIVSSPEPEDFPQPQPTDPGVMLRGRPAPGPDAFSESGLRREIGLRSLSGQEAPIPMRGSDPSVTAATATTPAGPPASAIRAIRMPGGRLLFTNRSELGGEEISTEEAGREIRAADRLRQPLRPESAMMRSLVQASTRAAEGRGEAVGPASPPMPGRVTVGQPPDLSPGVSFAEGTPQQQLGLALEDAMGAAALGQATQQAEMASMPVSERATLENKDIATGQWMVNTFAPRLETAREAARLAAFTVKSPVLEDGSPNPSFISDEKLRRKKLQDIEDDLGAATQDIVSLMSVIMRQRAPVL